MHEYLMQYGVPFILYILFVGVLQSLSVFLMAYKYVRPRKYNALIWVLLILIFAIHDTVWGLFGYYEGSNKYMLSLEILIWCLSVYGVVKFFCIGSAHINFTHLLGVEFVNQVFGMLFTFPVYMLACGFDLEKTTRFMNEPSLQGAFYIGIVYLVIALLSKCAWDFIYKHRGKRFHIILLIFCLADIAALILYSWLLVGISFLVVSVLVFMSFSQHNHNEKELREQFTYYQELAEKQERREREISVIRHDIANHINVMEEMQKNEEGQQLLKKIDRMNRSMTGIPVLDCLIREKASVCEKEGVFFEQKGGAIGQTKLTEYELISLFANLLDNAIEAAKMTEEKTVNIAVEKQQGVLKITVSNSKLAEQKPLESDFKTTKTDKKKHGIGSRIIRDIVEVNGGRITYYDEGEQMRVVVLMQL